MQGGAAGRPLFFCNRPTHKSVIFGESEMLGLGDWGVSLAYLLMIASALLCAVYGFLNWNKPAPEEELREIAEEEEWEKGELK